MFLKMCSQSSVSTDAAASVSTTADAAASVSTTAGDAAATSTRLKNKCLFVFFFSLHTVPGTYSKGHLFSSLSVRSEMII